MNAFSALVGMGVHGTIGAAGTTDFGKKGMIAGGVFGAGTYLLGEKLTEEDQGVGGAIASGFLTGSLQSAFSSAQEVYAFHNPGHISNVSSINTTTSATAIAQSMYAPFTQEGKRQWKNLTKGNEALGIEKVGRVQAAFDMFNTNMMTSENMLTDATRMAMIANDIEGGADKMLRLMGLSRDEGKFSPLGALKGQYQDMWEAANVADNGGVWFSDKPQTIEVEQKSFFGQKLDKDGNRLFGEYYDKDGTRHYPGSSVEQWGIGKDKWFEEHNIDHSKTKYFTMDDNGKILTEANSSTPKYLEPATKTVQLTGNETIAERMGMYLDANKNAYDNTIRANAAQSIEKGADPRFRDFDSYKNYVTSMDGGALGTYQELKRAGFYGKDAPKMKQAIAFGTETMYGSPAWARVLDKQVADGKASIENHRLENGQSKVRIKGGGKTRALALVADIATGGAINAAVNVGIWAASAPFKSNKDANGWANQVS